MRIPVLVLALALLGGPALHAQQLALAPTTPAAEPAPRPAESSAEATEIDIAPVRAEAVEVKRAAVKAETAQEPSARNLFTIVGVVVVVLALLAFLT